MNYRRIIGQHIFFSLFFYQLLWAQAPVNKKDNLLFYDQQRGEGELYSYENGTLTLVNKRNDWRTTWSQIVSFQNGITCNTANLVFYDKLAGRGELYKIVDNKDLLPIKIYENWRKTWDIIQSTNTGLLFYDKTNGFGEFYDFANDSIMILKRQYTDWRKSWNIISVSAQKNMQDGYMLCYEKDNGYGEVYQYNAARDASLVSKHTGWRKTWTTICPIGKSNFLFYDKTSGEAEIYWIDKGRFVKTDKFLPGSGYDQIIYLGYELVFYNKIKGKGDLFSPDIDTHKFRFLKSYIGWRKTWNKIILIDWDVECK